MNQSIPQRKPPVPSYVTVKEDGDRLVIKWRWFRWYYVALSLFCVSWDSFMLLWFMAAIMNGRPGAFMLLFATPHFAAGVGMTYWTLAGFRNSTRIVFDGVLLSVTHGPMRWVGNRQLLADDIEQLYCTPSSWDHSRRRIFDVWAITRGDRRIKLLGSLSDLGLALFVESKLEERLGIPDECVPGEVKEWWTRR